MSERDILVNLNGELLDGSQAKASVFDRSYLYGDSLYEVIRSYDGVFLKLDEHLHRLRKSADLTHIILGQSLEHYEKEIYRTYAAWRDRRAPGASSAAPAGESSERSERRAPGVYKDAYCRLIVSRGEGRIGFGLSCLTTPTLYTIIVQPLELPNPGAHERGYHFQVSKRLRNDPRALDPAMKTGNYLNSLLAYLEASAEGYDDALMLNADGHVTEGTTFNIFYVKRGIIVTPPLDIGILDGITRRLVIHCAKELGYPVREVRFPKERLCEADEVFMTSSVKEVFPVTRLDGRPIRAGTPGPVTRSLQKAYRDAIAREIAQATDSQDPRPPRDRRSA